VRTVWVHNAPCNKDLNALNGFYNDYEPLKKFIFDIIDKSELFKDVGINKKILLKPNWVYHNEKGTDELCLTTHPNVLLAVLEYVLQLKPRSLIIGDSPVQSCNWGKLHTDKFLLKIRELQEKKNISIKVIDFRNEKWEGKGQLFKKCRNKSDYLLYDLSTESFLEPLSVQNKSFRVGDYDSDETTLNHMLGTHRYLIAKEVIESEVIVNLPKLKTHQKAGITNGLKNHVGTIGEKSYLAHHSSNLSKSGGDCFPGNNVIRKAAEYFKELSYKHKGKSFYYPYHYLSSIIWRFAPRSRYANLSGAWYGNDTVWRMVLDINKIVSFGTAAGEISNVTQRKLVTISDGIIAGQGDGPLNPIPHAMGLLAISNNDMFLDLVMANMMGFDPFKIPLLRSYHNAFDESEHKILMDSNKITYDDLKEYSILTVPPSGWVGKIERV
jgi:uncharacterized protein (DUF362 family)